MRAAMPLLASLLLAASLSGCLGVDNMAEFKAALGFGPEPLALEPPVARLRASPMLATVGQAIAFSAQGSLDPQGAPLEFLWDFGDGASARGAEVSHRYVAAGAFEVTLSATGAAPLPGTDNVRVTIVDNRPPLAALAVLRGGQPVERAMAGEELTFAATVRDPEGQPLAVRWDFGDGATAATPEARHAYDHGGRFLVTLRAEDPSGLAGTAEQMLAVDQATTDRGEVKILNDVAEHSLDVAAGATALRVTVTLGDPMLGLNSLAVRVLDAQGDTVGELPVQPPPGTLGAFEAVLDIAAAELAGTAPGTWTLVVERASGLQVAYAFTAGVRY